MSPGASFWVRLNIMCSTQWEAPLMPWGSSRAPTRYQMKKVAMGAVCTSRVSTASPFASACSRTSSMLARGSRSEGAGCYHRDPRIPRSVN